MSRSAWVFCLAAVLMVGLGLVPPAALAQSSQSQTTSKSSSNAQYPKQGAAGQPSASAMQQQVQTALSADPALAGVTATANGNVVTLTGNVASSADKKRAANLASQKAAGAKIKNQITVKKGSK